MWGVKLHALKRSVSVPARTFRVDLPGVQRVCRQRRTFTRNYRVGFIGRLPNQNTYPVGSFITLTEST